MEVGGREGAGCSWRGGDWCGLVEMGGRTGTPSPRRGPVCCGRLASKLLALDTHRGGVK